jgi:hypothetical protein
MAAIVDNGNRPGSATLFCECGGGFARFAGAFQGQGVFRSHAVVRESGQGSKNQAGGESF